MPSILFDIIDYVKNKSGTIEISYFPKKEEIMLWKDWYEKLPGEDVDTGILSSNKKSVIEPAIIKILIKDYKSLGGDNKDILKSKDSKVIALELEKFKKLKNIFG